jgi:hypothetical protein
MVVTSSKHPGVIRHIYFELVHTVRLDNGKSHARLEDVRRANWSEGHGACCVPNAVLVSY